MINVMDQAFCIPQLSNRLFLHFAFFLVCESWAAGSLSWPLMGEDRGYPGLFNPLYKLTNHRSASGSMKTSESTDRCKY